MKHLLQRKQREEARLGRWQNIFRVQSDAIFRDGEGGKVEGMLNEVNCNKEISNNGNGKFRG